MLASAVLIAVSMAMSMEATEAAGWRLQTHCRLFGWGLHRDFGGVGDRGGVAGGGISRRGGGG